MTNKEKTRKIVEQYETRYNDTRDLLWTDLEDIAMQAMQWKEQQMIAFIDDEVNLIDTCLLKKAETKEMLYRYEGIIDGLLRVKNKIINK